MDNHCKDNTTTFLKTIVTLLYYSTVTCYLWFQTTNTTSVTTQEYAESVCLQAFMESTEYNLCQQHVTDLSNVTLSNCIEDIKVCISQITSFWKLSKHMYKQRYNYTELI